MWQSYPLYELGGHARIFTMSQACTVYGEMQHSMHKCLQNSNQLKFRNNLRNLKKLSFFHIHVKLYIYLMMSYKMLEKTILEVLNVPLKVLCWKHNSSKRVYIKGYRLVEYPYIHKWGKGVSYTVPYCISTSQGNYTCYTENP